MSVAGLRELVLGVVIVAVGEPGANSCATTTASYVSLHPPMVCVPLRPASRTAQLIADTGRFSLSVLTAEQSELAERAGHPATGLDKMSEIGANSELSPSAPGDPSGIGGSAAVLWCALRDVVTAGDHSVFFGEVTASRGQVDGPGGALLVRHHRRYLATGEPVTSPAPEGYPI
jgi:3-hydroxy-9,10-secoandrosta-1,3,5(10)-triene-9,17-dione monooxygenase reductase component